MTRFRFLRCSEARLCAEGEATIRVALMPLALTSEIDKMRLQAPHG